MNMRRFILLASVLIILTACAPSQESIQTAIAQTQAALPTIAPTNSPVPTSTPIPTKQPTRTALPQYEKTLDAIFSQITDIVATVPGVKSVTAIRPGSLSLEIELKTEWASKDKQPNVSFDVIDVLSALFGNITEEKALIFVGGYPEHFSILLTTYSADGDYKYSSLTYYDTLVDLFYLRMTYDEWVKESKAGFVKSP